MPCWGRAPGAVPGSHPLRAPRREPCTIVHFISHFAGDRTELWMSPHWVLMKAISGVSASVTDAAPWVRQRPRGRGQPRDRSSGVAVETRRRAGTCCLVLAPCCSHPTVCFCLILPAFITSSPGHPAFLSPSLYNARHRCWREPLGSPSNDTNSKQVCCISSLSGDEESLVRAV